MHEVVLLTERGAAGGLLVVAFALIGEVAGPKVFSGLFSAAPSIAVASLAITVIVSGSRRAGQQAAGMILGAVGMIVCCVVATWTIPKIKAVRATVAGWAAWLAISLGAYAAVFGGR